ncbi:hypothetical protein QT971_10305 [Microcoleus sp. herbarium19]
MIANFGIGLPTTPSFTPQLVDSQPSFTPQLVYSPNLDFVPSPDDWLRTGKGDGFWIELRGDIHDSLALQTTVRSYQRVEFSYACSK